jgi:5-hydroxyisourate hydrolase
MAGISTHVLDTARGRPAVGVPVRLSVQRAGDWEQVAEAATDADGRLAGLVTDPGPGVYRLWFDVAGYLGDAAFFPEVSVVFRITEAGRHHHVPLLLSPFGYSTYRGS